MRKILGIGLVAVLALAAANTVQATYVSAIGLNIAEGGASYYPGWVTGTQDGYSTYSGTSPDVVTTVVWAQNNWYNIDGGAQAPIVDLSIAGLTFNLVTIAGTQYGVDLNGVAFPGGWDNSPVNVPGSVGVATVDSFTITGIPYASYDVAIMLGYYGDPGTSWSLINSANSGLELTRPAEGPYKGTISGGTFTFTSLPGGDHTVFAIQILQNSGNSNSVPEPGTWLLLGGSLLGLCVGGFRRFRK